MTNYTDTQLKQALAKMLPETVECVEQMPMCRKELPGSELINGAWRHHSGQYILYWKHDTTDTTNEVLDTELLHLCWLVEEQLLETSTDGKWTWYIDEIKTGEYYGASIHATWQQRTIALAKVKGVEIV